MAKVISWLSVSGVAIRLVYGIGFCVLSSTLPSNFISWADREENTVRRNRIKREILEFLIIVLICIEFFIIII